MPRLAALTSGYGLSNSQSKVLPMLMRRRALAMRDLLVEGGRTGRQPWARLFREDHAIYWIDAAEWIRRHLE